MERPALVASLAVSLAISLKISYFTLEGYFQVVIMALQRPSIVQDRKIAASQTPLLSFLFLPHRMQ
jgi:hypothetical protein